MHESLNRVFDEIISYSHMWNWAPDWIVAKDIYSEHPEAYSVLTPFAYSYLEELIRSTTSEYGMELIDKNGKPRKRKVGTKLIELAIKENAENKGLISCLENAKPYFGLAKDTDRGDNRNSTAHGFMHSNYWSQESFEMLIEDIAALSPYAGF